MSLTEKVNRCLAAWGKRHTISLSLQDGVCALVDGSREVAVVELPADSDCVLFHSRLEDLKGAVSERYLRTLLALNFEMNAMRGCWLALDNDDGLRLCSQLPAATLNERLFSQTLSGFMVQAQEVSEFIHEIRDTA